MINALMFDLGNVVTTNVWHYDCPERDHAFESYFGVTMKQFEKGWNTAWPQIEIGKIDENEFWHIFLTESGVKNIDIPHAKKLWRKYQKVFPDSLNLIMRLRNRYPIVACTNNGKEWVDYYKNEYHLDAYFDAIINSAEVHVHKPDPEIYNSTINKTGYKPDEIVFIDDSDRPLQGARKLGIRTVKFENVAQTEKELKAMGVDTSILDISDRSHSFYWQSDRKISEIQIKNIFLSRHNFFDQKSAIKALETTLQKKVKHLIPPIKSGSINSVVRATLEDDVDVIMRMHPNALKNGYFWAEKAVADAANAVGVPTFKTILIDDTKKHVPFDFMITSCLPGENMKHAGPFTHEVDKKLIEDSGRLLALTHSIKTNGYGFFDNEKARKGELVGIHDSWKDHIHASLQDNLAYLIKMGSIKENERVAIQQIFKDSNSLIVCNSPRLVHNDLADWNELTDGNKITGFFDWDEAFSGDPVCDFSAYSVFYDDTRLNHLIRGYETVTKLPSNYEKKFHLYKLRYIISKMTLRTKRSVWDKSEFVTTLLAFSKKILQDELSWQKNNK